MENSEPRCCILDSSAHASTNEYNLRQQAIREFGVPEEHANEEEMRESQLQIQTGSEMPEQWNGKYICKAMPFTIPRCIEGPCFFPDTLETNTLQTPGEMGTITQFLRGFTRRIEAQCGSDWSAIPILRSLWFKYTAWTQHRPAAKVRGKKDDAGVEVSKHIRAMQNLAKALDKGFVGRGVLRMPVAGDVSKLPYAEGLDAFEKQLARDVVYRSAMVPGNKQVRQLMGRRARGAQVVFSGELFLTWSPNEEHSALVLRLMRTRNEDPMLTGNDDFDEDLRKCSKIDYPCILSTSTDSMSLALPLYHSRRKLAARNPRSVVMAFM